MLIFDHSQHRVSTPDGSVQLPPLSFKLLEKLAETPGEIQSVDQLTTAVWGDIRVSADTLKQRVFVLRKALVESELSQISIQVVRNEGYRLLIAQETPPEPTAGPQSPLAGGGFGCGIVADADLQLVVQPGYSLLK